MISPTRSATSPGTRRLAAIWTLALLATIALAGCSSSQYAATPPLRTQGAPNTSAFPLSITDDSSRTVTIKSEPKRVVSLAPANTEILFALGLGNKVVGVTSYDDYPPQVASITKVGDFAGPNIEAVAAAKPDVILATSGVQGDVVTKLEGLGAVVVVLDPQDLARVYEDIQRVGDVAGAPVRASQVVAQMKARVVQIQRTLVGKPPVRTFIEIGQNPLYTAGQGTLMNELITLAGGTNVVDQSGYVSYSAEQLIKANPDVYLATKGSSSDPSSIEKRAGYSSISAVKNGRIFIVNDDLVSRGGPRIIDGLAQIASDLHGSAGATATP